MSEDTYKEDVEILRGLSPMLRSTAHGLLETLRDHGEKSRFIVVPDGDLATVMTFAAILTAEGLQVRIEPRSRKVFCCLVSKAGYLENLVLSFEDLRQNPWDAARRAIAQLRDILTQRELEDREPATAQPPKGPFAEGDAAPDEGSGPEMA